MVVMLFVMKNDSAICCPVCRGGLVPVKWRCEGCDVEVTGRFVPNEFATLGEEDLHLLRIFVLCEGRIKDMEPALGVSYPTIKTRLARLRETLAAKAAASGAADSAAGDAAERARAAALKDLEEGRATFEQTVARLREKKRD